MHCVCVDVFKIYWECSKLLYIYPSYIETGATVANIVNNIVILWIENTVGVNFTSLLWRWSIENKKYKCKITT